MSSLGEKKKRMSMTARSQRHNLPALLCQLKEEGRVRTMVTEGWSGGVCRVEGRPGERESTDAGHLRWRQSGRRLQHGLWLHQGSGR